jgi:hypothetical protein
MNGTAVNVAMTATVTKVLPTAENGVTTKPIASRIKLSPPAM